MNGRLLPWLTALILTGTAAGAQNRLDIFVTPVPNAPFSGMVSVNRQIIGPNHAVIGLKTVRGIGRDSRGRIFYEARALVGDSISVPPLLTGIHLYDPQTRVATTLDPRSRTYQVRTLNRPPATEPPGLDFAAPAGHGPGPWATEEDLGIRQVNRLAVHGVRETQRIPAEESGTGDEVVITDEYWYSPDLHMNLALRHNDPRSGSVIMAVTQLTLAEPDARLFEIPEGYRPESAAPPEGGRRGDGSGRNQ